MPKRWLEYGFAFAALLAVGADAGAVARAGEKEPEEAGKLWSDEAEFGYVLTSGNSRTSTLALKNTTKRKWGDSTITVHLSGLRVRDEKTTRKALGSPGDFVVDESTDERTTAEKFKVSSVYSHKINKRLLWTAGAAWDRNRISGIDERLTVSAGLGHELLAGKNVSLRTDYSATYTDQTDVVPDPDAENRYLGWQLSCDYQYRFTESASFGSKTLFDESLRDTSNWILDTTNRFTVEINEHLALKVSLQVVYDHDPSLIALDLFDPLNPDGEPIGRVSVPADNTDTTFSTAMVVDF